MCASVLTFTVWNNRPCTCHRFGICRGSIETSQALHDLLNLCAIRSLPSQWHRHHRRRHLRHL